VLLDTQFAVYICSQLVSWDTRQGKVLMEYPEHVNSYSAVASVGIDRNDHFVYAGWLSRFALQIHYIAAAAISICYQCHYLTCIVSS